MGNCSGKTEIDYSQYEKNKGERYELGPSFLDLVDEDIDDDERKKIVVVNIKVVSLI
jgi:hypothetical protein